MSCRGFAHLKAPVRISNMRDEDVPANVCLEDTFWELLFCCSVIHIATYSNGRHKVLEKV